MLLDIAGDAQRLADLTAQISERGAGGGVRVQTDALLRLFKQVIQGRDATSRPKKSTVPGQHVRCGQPPDARRDARDDEASLRGH